MDIAYRVPDNETEGETPQKKFPKTKPITKNECEVYNWLSATNESTLSHKSEVVVRGVAWDDGHGIKKVLVSVLMQEKLGKMHCLIQGDLDVMLTGHSGFPLNLWDMAKLPS